MLHFGSYSQVSVLLYLATLNDKLGNMWRTLPITPPFISKKISQTQLWLSHIFHCFDKKYERLQEQEKNYSNFKVSLHTFKSTSIYCHIEIKRAYCIWILTGKSQELLRPVRLARGQKYLVLEVCILTWTYIFTIWF